MGHYLVVLELDAEKLHDSGVETGRSASGGPLKVDRTAYDFGPVASSKAEGMEAVFGLRNAGDRWIRIVRLRSSCGCMTPAVTQRALGPGETTSVRVKVAWGGRAGHQEEQVLLYTDNPKQPHIALTVSGFVEVPVALTPRSLNVGWLWPGEERTCTVTLSPGNAPRPFRLLSVGSATPHVSVTPVTPSPARRPRGRSIGERRRFAVTVVSPRHRDALDAKVVFRTTLEDTPELVLAVKGHFRGVLEATPTHLFFSSHASASDQTVVVRTAPGLNRALEPRVGIEWASERPCPFSVLSVEETSEQQRRVLLLTVGYSAADAPSGLCRAPLRIVLGQGELRVPLVAVGHRIN
jgi:hypothetical protein